MIVANQIARRAETDRKDAAVLAAVGRGARLRNLECALDMTSRQIRRALQRLRRSNQLDVVTGGGVSRRWVRASARSS